MKKLLTNFILLSITVITIFVIIVLGTILPTKYIDYKIN